MTVDITAILNFLRNAGSIAAIVISAANVGGLPTSVRAVLLAAGGVLQAVEHWATITGASTTPPAASKSVTTGAAPK